MLKQLVVVDAERKLNNTLLLPAAHLSRNTKRPHNKDILRKADASPERDCSSLDDNERKRVSLRPAGHDTQHKARTIKHVRSNVNRRQRHLETVERSKSDKCLATNF